MTSTMKTSSAATMAASTRVEVSAAVVFLLHLPDPSREIQ